MMVSTQAEMSLADIGSYFDHSFLENIVPVLQDI